MQRRRARRCPWIFVEIAILLCSSALARAQVITYEGNSFPELEGWERVLSDTPGAERSIQSGWLFLYADLPAGWTSITGDAEHYRVPLTGFVGATSFFVEWRGVSDNPSWLLEKWAGPTVVSAAGQAASLYQSRFTDTAAQLLRDIDIPRVVVPITSETPHRYRVEVFPDEYVWYVDGVIADQGVPEGTYPDVNAFLLWGVRRWFVDATTAFDYVRAGVIPDDATGDYDSDEAVTLIDHYFVTDCLTKDGPGIFGGPGEDAGPGCRFADFDADSDTDLLDFAEFQNLFGS